MKTKSRPALYLILASLFVFAKKRNAWKIKGVIIIILSLVSFFSFAQDPTDSLPGDPGAFVIFTIQNLNFGAFTVGSSGGTVIISTGGSRSATGDVIPLNFGITYYQAIFEVEAPEGTILSILNGPDATLTGSNGGSMLLSLDDSDPASPFTVTVPAPGRTSINIGATLTVGSMLANPPGAYTGEFYITLNQE